MADPIVAVFDTVEAAPEGLRPFLVELNGKHVPNFDIDKDPRVAPLKNAYERVKREKDERATQLDALKPWTELGLTIEQAKEKLAAADAKHEGDDSKMSQATKRWEQTQKQWEDRERDLTGKLGSKDRTIYDLVGKASAAEEIAKAKGNSKLLMPHVLGFTKVVEDKDGRYSVQIVGADGSPRLKDHLGNPMTMADLVEEFKKSDEFAAAFEGVMPSGSSATPATTRPPTGAITVSRTASKTNPALYQRAKETAAKTGQQVVFTD